jgi:hypothetical protein
MREQRYAKRFAGGAGLCKPPAKSKRKQHRIHKRIDPLRTLIEPKVDIISASSDIATSAGKQSKVERINEPFDARGAAFPFPP